MSPIPYGVGVALGFNDLIAVDIDTDDARNCRCNPQGAAMSPIKRGQRGFTVFGLDPAA